MLSLSTLLVADGDKEYDSRRERVVILVVLQTRHYRHALLEVRFVER
jgi:hypothetical protein